MLRDVEGTLTDVSRWAAENPIAGFMVMGAVAGLVATLRMYEQVGITFTYRTFFFRCVTKGLMGIFVALLLFFGWRASGWPLDWGYLAAGVGGVFATELLEAMFVTGVAFIRKRFGITPADIPEK